MSINNHARKTLLVTFTDIPAGGTAILSSAQLGDLFGSNDESGGYHNLTTEKKEDIVVVRRFTGNFVDSNYGPTVNEAWNAWTYPYDKVDGISPASSGSKMYILSEVSGGIELEFPEQDLYFVTDKGDTVKLPPISPTDVFYVIRKTKSNNKIVTFEPSARITANNLNTALDQNFFLGQEAEMWFQNYHKLSPALGKPNGICPLDAAGLIPTEYIAGQHLSRGDEAGAKWDALNNSIKNLPQPTADDYAANKQYVDAQAQYGGVLTPQQVEFAITAAGTHTAGTDKTYTPGPTWAQTDEDFFIVSIDGVLQIPDTDYEIPTDTTIKIKGDTQEGDVISIRNIGRTGANTVGSATVTSTGSNTGRTLAARFAERYNILDFAVDGYTPGASIGDGISIDASPTWNAAIVGIAAAGGGTMFIPRGYYSFTTRPKEVTGGINIEGEGPRSALVKRYNEDGFGTYAGAEGVYRGLISFNGATNNNTYIKRITGYNYEDGSESGDYAAHLGNGSFISIVADDDVADPGNVWISDVHCSAQRTAATTEFPSPSYKYWKCGIFLDGSEKRSAALGIRGIYMNGCSIFTAADAAIKAVAVNHLFIQGCESNVGRTDDGVGNTTICCGLKLEGGLPAADGTAGVETDRPVIMNCDFQSNYGIEIGTLTAGNRAIVRSAHFFGNIGQIHLGANAFHPMIVGTQTNARTIDITTEKYTLLTNGAQGADPDPGEASHSHIYGGLRLRGQGLTVGEVNSSDGEVYLPADGDLALYGKLEISKSAAPAAASTGTMRLYSDTGVSHGNLYARFDAGDPILIAREDGLKAMVLGLSEKLEDRPAGQSYWVPYTHVQSPLGENVIGPNLETWWLVENYGNAAQPLKRWPLAHGYIGAVTGTGTTYSGHIEDNGTLTWTLTTGGATEVYEVPINGTTSRDIVDCDAGPDAANLDDLGDVVGNLADVLATLLYDLRNRKVIK